MEVRRLKNNELYHFGILGMHWGVRRYQNKDGTLTADGRKRYGVEFLKQKQKEGIRGTEAYKKVKEAIDRPQNDELDDLSWEYESLSYKNNKKYKEFDKKLDKLSEEFSKPEVQLKYVKEAVNVDDYDGKFDEKTANESDLMEFKKGVWQYYNDDGDQGYEGSPFDLFCKSKGFDIYKEADGLDKEIREKREEVVNKIVSKTLGDVGDIEITDAKHFYNNGKIKHFVANALENESYGNDAYGNVTGVALSRTGFYDMFTDKVYSTYQETIQAQNKQAIEKGYKNRDEYHDELIRKGIL